MNGRQDIADLLAELAQLGASLSIDGDRLSVAAPEGAITPELAARIRASKPMILAELALREDDAGASDGGVPLSFLQDRFWAHEALDDGAGLSWLRIAWRIDGSLDDAAFCTAFDEVCASHEALAMRISAKGERQRLSPLRASSSNGVRARVEIADGAVDADAASARLEKFWATRPSLEEGPLFRALFMREDPLRATLALSVHHTIWDGASSGILIDTVARRYSARAAGEEPEARDVATLAAQSAALEKERRAAAASDLAYWRDVLRSPPAPYEPPTDRQRPELFDHAGGWVRFDLPPEDMTAARALARAEKTTPFVVFLAVWAAFLGRLSGQDDIIVTSPAAVREDPALRDALGCYVTTLHFRARPVMDASGRNLIAELRESVIEGAGRVFAAPDEIAAEIGIERDPARTPLAQTLFDYRQSAPVKLAGGATVDEFAVNPQAVPCDISACVVDAGDGGRVEIQYATVLFSSLQAQAVAESFMAFLPAFLADPDCQLGRLPMMDEEARAALLESGRGAVTDAPSEGALGAIAATAAAHPGAVAIVCDGRDTTYRALTDRANAIASALAAAGIGEGAIVGVMAGRGPDLVAACLAAWRVGAAYLPLDPTYPEDRLSYMVADSGALALIADEAADFDILGEAGAASGGRRLIALEDVSHVANDTPPPAYDPDRRAYVIYTSGSTGRPKGVENTHGALANFLRSMAREPGLSRDDTLLAVTTLSFDISILELFLPLAVGARTILASSEDSGDPFALDELLADATVMQATPATWRLLVDSGWGGSPRLKALCGGEALTPSLAGDLLSRVGALWNMYGPTETTVWSACKRIDDASEVSVGRAIDNTRLYIVDGSGALRPQCASGELWIGGDGVAAGYLGRPELTAERFLDDPFAVDVSSDDRKARVYRTGDLARWTASGEIEILGRMDSQVKVRGFRIELGEIEAALDAAPGVEKCVAAVRPDAGGEPAIVAYVRLRDGVRATGSELRRALRETLPAYMLPQFFVELEAIPLTENGKVDRKALPDPAIGARPARERTPPRSALEQAIAEIWRELLPVEDVAVTDNFFELGGQSLQAARMAAIVKSRTGKKVSARAAIFETLEQIARAAEAS